MAASEYCRETIAVVPEKDYLEHTACAPAKGV
jgi:hypothetical protein